MEVVPAEGAPGTLAVFSIRAGPRIGEDLAVPGPVVHIGAGPKNEVVIEDDSVSQQHARLEFERGAWRITDLESTNGTFVEGVRLAPEVPTPLPYGSSVRFGGVRTHFRPVASADPAAARTAYVPPPAPPKPVRERPRAGFPLWAVVLLLVVLALLGWLLWTQLGGEPAVGGAAPLFPPKLGVVPLLT